MAMTTAQLPNESAPAYAAFLAYAQMGDKRSLESVGRKVGKNKALMEKWSSRHEWQKRVRLWDAENAEAFKEAQDKELRKRAKVLADRIAQQKERDWEDAQKGRKLLSEALKRINVQLKKGEKVSISDYVRLAQLVTETEHLACDLPTSKTEVTGPDNTPVIQSAAPIVIMLPDNGRDKT